MSPASDGDQTPEKEPATPRTHEQVAPGRIVAAIVFALVALAFFVFGVMFLLIPSGDLPGFMGRVAGSRSHHGLRAVGSVLVGLVFTAAAWFALRYQSLALEQARAADVAALAAEAGVAGSDAAGPGAGAGSGALAGSGAVEPDLAAAEAESTAAGREA